MISIIFPSRQRQHRATITANMWLEKAGCNVELLVSLDSDDPSSYANVPGVHLRNDNRSAIDAINFAAKYSTGNILIQIAEDFECPDNWGAKILDFTKGKTDWILKTQDGIQEWIITLPIMDRAYYNRFGYIYYPEYKHMFCDTEMSCVADLLGRRLTSDLMFKHNNEIFNDEVRKKSNSTWDQGEKLFLSRYRNNFGLSPEQIKGKITNQNYINWAKSKGA